MSIENLSRLKSNNRWKFEVNIILLKIFLDWNYTKHWPPFKQTLVKQTAKGATVVVVVIAVVVSHRIPKLKNTLGFYFNL